MGDPPSSPPQALPESLRGYTGLLISRTGVIAQKRFSAKLEAVGLTPRMWGALNVLEAEGPVTQGALCKGIGMDPSSMVSTIDELEAKGFVKRRPHPGDRRAHALHVTDSGRETLLRGRKVALAVQDELLAPLSTDEREQLRSLLLRIAVAPSL